MLRLVNVTALDVDCLFELVTMHEVPDKQDLLAGLMQLHHHFVDSKDKFVKTVFTPPLFKQMVDIVEIPFMPADADKHGVPIDRYHQMCALLPIIRKNFAQPDLMDPEFLGVKTKAPSKAYLN